MTIRIAIWREHCHPHSWNVSSNFQNNWIADRLFSSKVCGAARYKDVARCHMYHFRDQEERYCTPKRKRRGWSQIIRQDLTLVAKCAIPVSMIETPNFGLLIVCLPKRRPTTNLKTDGSEDRTQIITILVTGLQQIIWLLVHVSNIPTTDLNSWLRLFYRE